LCKDFWFAFSWTIRWAPLAAAMANVFLGAPGEAGAVLPVEDRCG
jgi:hypothetical protein